MQQISSREKGANPVEKRTPAIDITERTAEFTDFETNKLKIVILDGETGKVSLVHLPFHGATVIETYKGAVRKFRYEDEYLL